MIYHAAREYLGTVQPSSLLLVVTYGVKSFLNNADNRPPRESVYSTKITLLRAKSSIPQQATLFRAQSRRNACSASLHELYSQVFHPHPAVAFLGAVNLESCLNGKVP